MGDLILLAKAAVPGRNVANRSVSPHGHAARETARSDDSLIAPEGRIRAGDGDSVRESRPSARIREGGRRTPARTGRRAAAPSTGDRSANGAAPVPHPQNASAAVLLHAAVVVHNHRAARPVFFFDLACPFSYIAAERVERLLGDIEWVPTPSEVVQDGGDPLDEDIMRVKAVALAGAARLPLIWPEHFPAAVPRALRAAAYAAEMGAGARFALAASRLAFCGGFDLEEPSVLADVAAAAGVSRTACLAAAAEGWRDDDLILSAQMVRSLGASRLPVVSVGERWFDGLHALSEAASWLRQD
jgi:2-hydroxychromene-2-carboxylate isomerase